MQLESLSRTFHQYLQDKKQLGEPDQLYDPINYIMNLGGKRIRPLLVMASNRIFTTENSPKILDLALIVEMFHNFTLLHDDIMDRANLRRGQETVHIKWDEPTAILSGDLMLIKVYERLGKLDSPLLLTAFSKMATELCEGQMMDMQFIAQEKVSVDDYLKMIRGKTAVLLAFCLESVAIMHRRKKEVCELFYSFGIHLGLAFQLMDDYLDSFGNAASFGKRIGGDILERKKTYLWNYMMQHLSEDEAKSIHSLYESNKAEEEIIAAVKEKMQASGAAKANLNLANSYTEKAKQDLNSIAQLGDVTLLNELIELLSSRQS